MIDLKALESQNIDEKTGLTYFDSYKKSLIARGSDSTVLDEILKINLKRKECITQLETTRSDQNKVGQEIAIRKKNKENVDDMLSSMQEVSAKVKQLTADVDNINNELNNLLVVLPNHLDPSVPVGKGEEDNQEIRNWGEIKSFNFAPKEHGDLGENLDILDFSRAGKVTGARFTFLKGAAASLERALIQFMMDQHSQNHGYEEMIPPFIVNSSSLFGTGQFPKFKEDVFQLANTDYYLVPTAEVPVTNYFANEVLKESELPKKYCAYTPCFRSEAGSYGKDTKGLIRQHQFNKVELMVFAHPNQSNELHEALTGHAEKILQLLELPYRVMVLCSKDIGFGASKCFDIEVWLPGQGAYREISSCSNYGDFQARRADIRFRPDAPKSKPQYVHTINGSGLAVGRTLIAILENYQQPDGSILVPERLVPYMGGKKVITFNK